MRRRSVVRRGGAVVVEAALVVPPFLLALIGLLEYSRYFAVCQILGNAVREGARFAVVRVVDRDTLDDQVRDNVHELAAGWGSQLEGYSKESSIRVFKYNEAAPEDRSVSWKEAAFGQSICVEIEGTYRSALVPSAPGSSPLIGTHSFRVRSVMYSEAN